MSSRSTLATWLSLAVVCLWGLAPLLWFIPGHLILGVDLQLPVDTERWRQMLWAWNERWGTGFEWSVGFSTLPFAGVSALLSLVTPNLQVVERGLFIFWFLLPGLTCFWLARELFPDSRSWIRWLAMTNFYMFNLFLQAMWGGNEAGLSAYAALPLVLVLYLRGLRTRRYVLHAGALGLSSLLLSASSSNMPLLSVALFGWGIMAAVYVILERLWREPARCWAMAGFTAAALLVMVLCNAFWILPQADVNGTKILMPAFSSEAIATAKGWLGGISSDTTVARVLRLQGDWTWYQGWYEPYRHYAAVYRSNPWMVTLSWLIVLVVLYGALRSRARYRAAFLLMAIVGVVLGTGVHPPFGVLYRWLVDHFPYFWVFRSPWFKFTVLTCLGYAFLFGEGIAALAAWRPRGLRWAPPAMVCAAALVANMVYAFPVAIGQMHAKPTQRIKLKPAHVAFPPYVMETAHWVRAQPGFFRLMTLPAHMNRMSLYRWGYGTTVPALYPFVDRPVVFDTLPSLLDFGNQLAGLFARAVYGPATLQAVVLPQRLGVRYLIHETDFDHDYFEDGPGYPLWGDTPEFVKSRLARQPGIHYARSFGAWDVYEVDAPRPRLEIATRAALVVGPADAWPALLDTPLVVPERALVFLDGIEDAMERPALDRLAALGMLDALVVYGTPTPEAEAFLRTLPGWRDTYLLQPTEPLAVSVQDHPATRIPEVQTAWVDSTALMETDEAGVAWRWMQPATAEHPAEAPHLVITNRGPSPQLVNVQWTTQSFKRPRDLFVYINGELKKTFRVEPDRPTTVCLQDVTVAPGTTKLRFYTPYAWDAQGPHNLCFGFQEDSVQVGRLTYDGQLWVPSAGTYTVSVTPMALPERLSGTIPCTIHDVPLTLRAQPNQWRYQADRPVMLPAGAVPIQIDQIHPGMQYLIRLVRAAGGALPPAPRWDARTVSPVEHHLRVDTTTPVLLIFRETYYPFWEAREASGQVVTHRVLADGFGNGFLLETPGAHDVTIAYTVQPWFSLGWRIAAGALAACAAAMLWGLVSAWRGRR